MRPSRFSSWCLILSPRTSSFASIGMTVRATSSEASIAVASVMANGRNSWPAIPLTMPRGANTPTVVRVEDVMAAPTSIVAFLMTDSPRSSAFCKWV
ncbi:hypothetical protein D1872_251470 [compost metagenome]